MSVHGGPLLVTGASGDIGTALRELIERSGRDAVYLVSPAKASVTDGRKVRSLDIADRDALRAVVADVAPDAIIHLASLVGGACAADPARARAVNVEAVRTLAAAAAEAGVRRVVLASTAGVYGDQFDAPVSERDITPAPSIYARTKLDAENVLAEASDATFLSTVALRIFNVFGPGLRNSLVTRLRESTKDAPVALSGLDTFVRDYIHVKDVADALLAAADVSLGNAAEVINVGSGVAMSNRQLVEALSKSQPVFYDVSPEIQSYSCADNSKALRLLQFSPEHGVAG